MKKELNKKTENRLLLAMWIVGITVVVLMGLYFSKMDNIGSGIWIFLGSVWIASAFCSLLFAHFAFELHRIKEEHKKWIMVLFLCPIFNIFLALWLGWLQA